MTIMGISRFERFFRSVGGFDVHKDDLKRYSDFVNRKLHDLLIAAVAAAEANDRDVIEPPDLPVTKGLQESIREFRKVDEGFELRPIIEQLETLPPLDLAYGDEVADLLPTLAGAMSVALARTFRIIDPKLAAPHSEHWERAFRIFDLLL